METPIKYPQNRKHPILQAPPPLPSWTPFKSLTPFCPQHILLQLAQRKSQCFLDFFTLVLFVFTFISLLPLYKCLFKLVGCKFLLVLEHAVNTFYAINLSKKNPVLRPHGVFTFRIIFTTTSNYFPKQH